MRMSRMVTLGARDGNIKKIEWKYPGGEELGHESFKETRRLQTKNSYEVFKSSKVFLY